jgi:hypothetical protein
VHALREGDPQQPEPSPAKVIVRAHAESGKEVMGSGRCRITADMHERSLLRGRSDTDGVDLNFTRYQEGLPDSEQPGGGVYLQTSDLGGIFSVEVYRTSI